LPLDFCLRFKSRATPDTTTPRRGAREKGGLNFRKTAQLNLLAPLTHSANIRTRRNACILVSLHNANLAENYCDDLVKIINTAFTPEILHTLNFNQGYLRLRFKLFFRSCVAKPSGATVKPSPKLNTSPCGISLYAWFLCIFFFSN